MENGNNTEGENTEFNKNKSCIEILYLQIHSE